MRPRVVYWNNIPAPYMVERFDAVARRGNLNFEAWFSSRTEKGRSWKVEEGAWQFRHRYLRSVQGGAYPLALPTPVLRGAAPDLIVTLYAAPAFLLGAALAGLRGARTAFWVEPTFDALVRRRRWKERVKASVLPRADAILTAGQDGVEFAMRYGTCPGRVFVVPHVIDFERYQRASAMSPDERERLRTELGLRGVAFAYAGRLWLGKGLEYLVRAFAAVQRSTERDVSLLLIGDGADEGFLRASVRRQGASNVVFAGFQHDDALPPLLSAADVFVFPALGDTFGMALSEAMACGLPVITTTSTGEITDRVAEGLNGFVVPPADSDALRTRMLELAMDGHTRQRMGVASRERVRGQSPDVWAEAFERAVDGVLGLSRSQSCSRMRRRRG